MGNVLKKNQKSTSNQVTPSDEGGRYDNNSMNNIIDKIVCYFKISLYLIQGTFANNTYITLNPKLFGAKQLFASPNHI